MVSATLPEKAPCPNAGWLPARNAEKTSETTNDAMSFIKIVVTA
jgi:hypothetical protein